MLAATGTGSQGSGSAPSLPTSTSPFSNTSSVGRLTRTYLAVARKLKMERHGKLADEIGAYDAEAARLDAQDKRVEAFLFKERSLVLRQKLYGPSHKVVTDCAKDLTLQYSVVAMDLIRGGDTVESLKLLEKAQILSSSEVLFPEELPRKQLLAVMYNNFGCYYKFLSKLHTAWKYLQKALLIESTVPGCHNPAGTHLNVCALLSQMGRHRGALHHAQNAIHALKQEREKLAAERAMQDALRIAARGRVAATSDDAASDASGRSEGSSTRRRPEVSSSNTSLDSAGAHRAGSVAPFQYPADLDGAQVGQAAETDVNKSCLMVIALYNAAVELEHLSSLPDAVEYYQEALQVATSELGSDHALVESVSSALAIARRSSLKAVKRPLAPYDDSMEAGSVVSDMETPPLDRILGRGMEDRSKTPMSTVSDSARQGKRTQGRGPEGIRLPAVGASAAAAAAAGAPGSNTTWSPVGGLASSPRLHGASGAVSPHGAQPSPPSGARGRGPGPRVGSFRDP